MSLIKVFYLLLLASPLSIAGKIEQVEIKGRPTMEVGDDGSVKWCGMGLTVTKKHINKEGNLVELLFYSSMTLDTNALVILKGSAHSIAEGRDGKVKASEIPLEMFWIKSGKEKATIPYRGRVIRGDNGLSVAYVDENGLSKSSAFMDAIGENRPILISAKLKKEANSFVFSGPVKVSREDWKSFGECNLELMEGWNTKQ
jgi:hypothetical protein